MKNVQSYNKEIKIATAQFKDTLNNIKIHRFDVNNEIQTTIDVPIKYGPRSVALKSLENRKNNQDMPVIGFSRTGFGVDSDRVFNINQEILLNADNSTDYSLNHPIAVNIQFEVSIYSMDPKDDDQIVQNFIPFSMPNFYVAWKHPYTNGTLKSQVIWSGDISNEYPVDFEETNSPRIITTTSFIFKTWIFPGSALTDGNGRIPIDDCDLIRKVITEWYDSTDAYDLLAEGFDLLGDEIEYNSYPKPYYANPKQFELETPTNISVFGANFKETMLVYLTATDEALGPESPIIIDGVDSGLTGILTDYTYVSEEKFTLADISSDIATEIDIIIVSFCGNIEKISDNQGFKIIVAAEAVMPVGDHYISVHQANSPITLPLVSGVAYDFVVDWGDGSKLEQITSAYASHNYATGIYTITLGGTVPRLSYDLVPTSAANLLEVTNLGNTGLTTLNGMFSNCTNLTSVTGGVFSVTDMSRMFNRCFSLTSFDYTTWDFSNVTTMDEFLSGVELDHTYYSDFLLWMYDNLNQTTFTFDGGNSEYNIESTVPRFRFEQDRDWTITDGGFYGEMYQPEYNIDVANTTIRLPLLETNTYAFVVNWGDGSDWVIIEDPNSIEILHTYVNTGIYTIEIQGLFEAWRDAVANIKASFEILYHVYDSLELTLSLSPDGVYDFIVDWGDDGPTDHITAWDDIKNAHSYTYPNDYYVTITGICTIWLNKEVLVKDPYSMNYLVPSDDLFVELPLVPGYAYDFDVDWGDGTTDYIDAWDDPDKLHEYAHPGAYIVSIVGVCEKWKTLVEQTFNVFMDVDGTATLVMDENVDGVYDFTINWDDGNYSAITEWDDPDRIHTYSITGDRELFLKGDIDGTVEVVRSYAFDIVALVDFVNVTLVMDSGANYDYTVDWGDGNSSTITGPDDVDKIHEYATAGNYTIELVGDIDGTISASSADPLLFNITAEVDGDIATMIMDSAEDYDYTVDWGDGSATSNVTAFDDPNRIHEYTLADDYTITAHGLINGTLSVNMRGEVIIPDVLGMISFGGTHIKTAIVPATGFEFELDVRETETVHSPDPYSIMGVVGVNAVEYGEIYRSIDSTGEFYGVWGANPYTAIPHVPRTADRTLWAKDELIYSIGADDATLTNDNFDSGREIYLFARNEVGGSARYFATAIIYGFKSWSDSDRLLPSMDLVPVVKGSTQYSVTPAPDHGYWDTITEAYFTADGGTLYPIKAEERTEWDAPEFGLIPDGTLYLDCGISIKKHFDWELDLRNTIDVPTDNGYAIMGNDVWVPSPSEYVELIRLKDATFQSVYGNPAANQTIGPEDKVRHLVSKVGITYTISGIGSCTLNDDIIRPMNIYLWQRHENNTGAARYYAPWEIFSFRVWCNAARTELLQELLPVPVGNTYYSSTAAPSNCFWDTVSEQYIEPIGNTLSIVGTVPPYML